MSADHAGAGRADGTTFVRFRGVSKSYDGRSMIVRDLDLDVQEGEFLTLLGPSGSGKTTTLMMLAGFEAQSRGSIELAGASLDHTPPYRRGMGMVFQQYALFPHMTVAENVAYPLKVRRMPAVEAAAKVSAALEMVRMEAFASRYPGQLSGGQQQRIALARALVFNPRLVLMDEPLGALDKQLRERMQYEIRRIHGLVGCTTVYVTHDQAEAMSISDRIAVFAGGVVEQIGSPSEIYNDPATLFVASFIGENNILAGTVCEQERGAMRLHLAGGAVVVEGPSLPAASKDAKVTLTVRPEALKVVAAGQAARSDATPSPVNSLRGIVSDMVFLGDHTRVWVSCGEAGSLLAKAESACRLGKGAEVDVRWDVADGRTFLQ
jgi:putative spermidine/putrescine transport system ATP-binding protein